MNRVGGVTMANIKSAKKRVRVNAVKAEQNKALKSELKKIDQACAKGLLHKNNASRKKANLAVKLAANA